MRIIENLEDILLDKEVRRVLNLIYCCPQNTDEVTIVLKSYNNRVERFAEINSPVDNDEYLIRQLNDNGIAKIVGSGTRHPNYTNKEDFDWQLSKQLKEQPTSYVYLKLKIHDLNQIEKLVYRIIDKFNDSHLNIQNQIEDLRSYIQLASTASKQKIVNFDNKTKSLKDINILSCIEELVKQGVVKSFNKKISVYGKNWPKWEIRVKYLLNNNFGNERIVFKSIQFYKDTGVVIYPKINNKKHMRNLLTSGDTCRLFTAIMQQKSEPKEIKDIEIVKLFIDKEAKEVKPGYKRTLINKIHAVNTMLGGKGAITRNSAKDGYLLRI